MRGRAVTISVLLCAVVATACSESSRALPDVPDTIVSTTATDADATTTTSPSPDDATTTTTTTASRLVTPPTEAPPFDDVAIGTEDGVTLHGALWEGGEVAVLVTHDFNHAYEDSEPVNGLGAEQLAPWTWGIAEAGYTVLALDLRGHGLSQGAYSVLDSPLDMEAAYRFLVDRGHTTIVGMPWGGSAPVMAHLSATDPTFDLAGLGMLFTPLANTGFDGKTSLEQIDEPVWLVGIDLGSFGGVTKRLEPSVQDLYGNFVFPRVPTGLGFDDVYGEEWLGRQLDFLDAVTGS